MSPRAIDVNWQLAYHSTRCVGASASSPRLCTKNRKCLTNEHTVSCKVNIVSHTHADIYSALAWYCLLKVMYCIL